MPGESRLQMEHPFPGDTVPKYRYRYYASTDGMGIISTYVSAGGGAATITELTTGSLAGVEWDAATDDHAMFIFLPSDVDVNAPIDVRVHWSSDQTTTADSYTWDIKYREVGFNSTTGMNTAPTSTLDTTIAADTNLVTANAAQFTAWGTINGGSLTGTEPDYGLHLLIDPSAVGGTISDDVVIVWGVQFRYMPKTM